jgi:recombination protein RecT
MSKAVAKAEKHDVASLLNKQLPAFQQALGSEEMARLFTRVALTMVRLNPRLAQCDEYSFLGGLMMGAELKLNFHLGYAYLIPYWSEKQKTYIATFQVGYQGWIELFFRHPLAAEMYAEVVYEGDKFKISKGTSRKIVHEPHLGDDRGEIVGFYAVAKLKSGAMNFAYMTKDEMDAHWQKTSPKSDAWRNWYIEMSLKTMAKKVLKMMPKSVEISRAMSMDEGIKRPVNEKDLLDIDSVPTVYQEVEAEPEPDEKPKSKKSKAQPPTNPKEDLIERINKSPIGEQERDEYLTALKDAETDEDLKNIEKSLKMLEHSYEESDVS